MPTNQYGTNPQGNQYGQQPMNQYGNQPVIQPGQQLFQPGAGSDYAMRMRIQRARETAEKTPSVGAVIAKCAIGATFIIAGIFARPENHDLPQIAFILTGLVIGAAFILWGILGYRAQQRKIEDARTLVALSTPLNTYGNAELNGLAEKYDQLYPSSNGSYAPNGQNNPGGPNGMQ